MNGDNNTEPITVEEIEVFEAFLSAGTPGAQKNILFGGQYVADSPLVTDFVTNYLKTQHNLNSNIEPFSCHEYHRLSGDTVGDGLNINTATGVLNNMSPGTCNALSGALMSSLSKAMQAR